MSKEIRSVFLIFCNILVEEGNVESESILTLKKVTAVILVLAAVILTFNLLTVPKLHSKLLNRFLLLFFLLITRVNDKNEVNSIQKLTLNL